MLKNTIYLLFFSVVFFSCGSDDDCTTESVLGTYVGSSQCNDPTLEGPTSITVTMSGSNLLLEDQDGQEFAVSLDGCSFDIPEVSADFFGVQITADGDGDFDGETLNVNINTTVDGVGGTCRFQGTRQ